MPIFTLINALLPLLSAVPSVEQDLADAFRTHWGKDHVQQAVTGLRLLSSLVDDIAEAFGRGPDSDPVPVPLTDTVTGSAG